MPLTIQNQIFENPNIWHIAQGIKDEQTRAQAISKMIPHGTRYILDAGCGNGVLTNMLSQFVIGLDLSMNAISFVNKNKLIGDLKKFTLC